MLDKFLIVALLVSVAAAFATPEFPQARVLCPALLAIAVLAAAVFTSSFAIARLVRRLRLFLLVILVVPAVYMTVQLVPIPIHGSGNPIWAAASAALNSPPSERLTVDIDATVQAFLQYIAAVALALIAAIVALDKQRAWQLLTMLVSVSAVVSAYLLMRQMMGADGLSSVGTPVPVVTDAAPSVLGLVMSAAMAARAFEERRRAKQLSFRLAAPLSFALLAMFLCLSAILARADGTGTALAALLGAGIVFAAVAIQNWFYGVWGMASVFATAAILFLAAFTLLPVRPNTDLAIALSAQHPAATERMLQDAGQVGSGAGTYVALLPIHRDIGGPSSRERPTAAAVIAIEMGRPFLYGLLIVAVLAASALLRCSLQRKRDYAYAAIGSGAAAALAMLALVEDGILEFGTSMLAAATLGLAVAQSQRDTTTAALSPQSTRPVSEPDSSDPASKPARQYGNLSMRIGLGSVAVALCAQMVWLYAHPRYPGGLPLEAPSANQAARQASVGAPLSGSLRGDGGLHPRTSVLAQLPIANEPAASKPEIGADPAAPTALARALQYSPLRGDLWLMLAALSKEQRSAEYDVAALLKLSYYTAPSDLALLPLRLTVALGEVSAANEPELRELVQRDIKIALTKQPNLRPALVAAYQSASAEGKSMVNNLISEWDSAALQRKEIRAPAPGTVVSPPNSAPGRGTGR